MVDGTGPRPAGSRVLGMSTAGTALFDVAAAAGRQHGLITGAQARRLGLDDRALADLVAGERLLELTPGVYQLADSDTGLWLGYHHAAWLALSPESFAWERAGVAVDDAVLSHESACRLHGIGVIPSPTTVFTVPRAMPAPRATRLHVTRLDPDDVTTVGGLAVTTPHRSLLDVLRDHVFPTQVHRAMSDAVRRDLVDLGELYTDLVPLADPYEIPIDGPAFLESVMPEVRPDGLSPRNLRAYAALRHQDRVAAAFSEVLPVAFRVAGRAGVDVEVVSLDVAQEIVGRLLSPAGSFTSHLTPGRTSSCHASPA